MEDLKVKVFVNGDMSRSAEVGYHPHMQYRDFLTVCRERLKLKGHPKCRLFDSTGDEYSDDDMEDIDPSEPLFLSQGEDFQKTSSLALYEEVKDLGEGGFGLVKLYRHRFTRTEVAIKFVELKSMESFEDINRIFTEMNVLRGLHHPHIVTLLETFNLPDKLCLVMEYCRGGELKKVIDTEGPLSEDRAYSICTQLIEAMQYCHNCSVVHRDLKLENILFSDTMHLMIKVVDFGIAGAFKFASYSETSNAGSLLYTAPEVITGSDTRSVPTLDIWSIGCIFYYLLTGRHPFEAGTLNETVENILAGKYDPLPSNVSAPWTHVIRGALQVKPEKRWDLLRIEAHLQKHREDLQLCVDCLYGVEEVKTEEKKTAPGTRERHSLGVPVLAKPLNKSKSYRDPNNSSHRPPASPLKAHSPNPGDLKLKPVVKTTRPSKKA